MAASKNLWSYCFISDCRVGGRRSLKAWKLLFKGLLCGCLSKNWFMKGHNCSCKSHDFSCELSPGFTSDIHVVTLGLNHTIVEILRLKLPGTFWTMLKLFTGAWSAFLLGAAEIQNTEMRIFEGHLWNSQRTVFWSEQPGILWEQESITDVVRKPSKNEMDVSVAHKKKK